MGEILSTESALEQVDLLFRVYEIDLDDYDESGQRTAVRAAKNKLIRAVKNGRVSITENETIEVVQKLKYSYGEKEPITELKYREVDARSKVGARDDDDDRSRLYMFLGNLSGVGLAGILKLRGVDLGVAETLGTVFLQV
jgi:hypothetical protein